MLPKTKPSKIVYVVMLASATGLPDRVMLAHKVLPSSLAMYDSGMLIHTPIRLLEQLMDNSTARVCAKFDLSKPEDRALYKFMSLRWQIKISRSKPRPTDSSLMTCTIEQADDLLCKLYNNRRGSALNFNEPKQPVGNDDGNT